MIEALCTQISTNPKFQEMYSGAIEGHLKASLFGGKKNLNELVYKKLIQSALHFSMSTNHNHKLAAFKLAVALYDVQGFEKSELVKAVFARLGNFPSISRFFPSPQFDLPMNFWTELESHHLRNTVNVLPDSQVTFTDFQLNLWTKMVENQNLLTVTAPTSAGKSFSLKMFLLNQLAASEKGIFVYTVPSRALISQVIEDLRPDIRSRFGSVAAITGAPTPPAEIKKDKIIYVLTQERLQNLLEECTDIKFSYMFVDEAQTISDDSRGILLQNVIEKVLSHSTNQKILFGSPFLKNPEVFHEIFQVNKPLNIVRETESPVGQNLIRCKYLNGNFQLDLVLDGKVVGLGSHQTGVSSQKAKSSHEVLAETCSNLSFGSASIVYAGGPASCEEIAESLAGLEGESDKLDPLIEDFSKFLKTHIHKSYLLSEVIKSGVGFHYGRMPTVIRKTVEDLFSDGLLSHIVCTSTLLHGVNLPAKNLFIRKPTKGRDRLTGKDIPLTSSDFWNLAGRAGRLGKEFEGNVFLVDYDEWNEKPLEGDKEQSVDSSLHSTIQTSPDELSDFIADHNHASGVNDKFEATFMRLYSEKVSGTLDNFLSSRTDLKKDLTDKIQNNIDSAVNNLTIPSDLAQKNPSISVLRQDELFKYFQGRINTTEEAEDCIPAHPKSNSYRSILRVFNRIHKYLQKLPTTDRRPLFFTPFAIDWMRGAPLAMLIGKRIDYLKKETGSEPNVASTIRDVMTIVETDLRFRYVNFTKCHNDILEYVLLSKGFKDVASKIPALSLYLEFGACSETMINLIGMGLSRSTSSILEPHLSPQMKVEELVTWLGTNKWKNISLPLVCYREISKHLGVA